MAGEIITLTNSINNENYVEFAEKTMKELKYKPTTSQIRNILSLISQIYNEAVLEEEILSGEIANKIKYLKVRIVYERGRDSDRKKEFPVKTFVDESQLISALDSIKNSKKKFVLFSKYVEALVAYHKYYGGKD